MTHNQNPGALAAPGASAGDLLGGNPSENNQAIDLDQASLDAIEDELDFAPNASGEDNFSKLFKAASEESAAKGETFSFDLAPRSTMHAKRGLKDTASTHATSYRVKGMDELPDPLQSAGNYLVKGLVAPAELSVWYGQPGAGKSFFLLYLAYCIALGLPVLGRRVKKAKVLYVILEAPVGFERRLAAIKQVYGDAENFKWITQPVDLFSGQADLKGIIAAALDCGAGIVIIDTLARVFGPGNENESAAMGTIISALDRIKDDTGAHVAMVHHSGKNEDRGPRGHSSLKGAVSVVVEFKRDEFTRTAIVEKNRDGMEGDKYAFDLRRVVLGSDEDGDEVTTCVAVPSTEPLEPGKAKLSGQPKAAYDLLVRAINDKGQVPPAGEHLPRDKQVVTEDEWRHYCYEGMGGQRDKPDTKRKAFDRARIALKNKARIGVWGGFVWVI
jgi:hypothetical protein